MAKRNKKKFPLVVFWLSVSMAGGVLFSFGLLNLFSELGYSAKISVMIGMIMIGSAIFLGQYRTETSVAMRKL